MNSFVRSFTNLMFQGATSAALKLILDRELSGVLDLGNRIDPNDPNSQSVLDVLKSKHPASHPSVPDSLISPTDEPPTVHPVIFDRIDACCVKTAALWTFGAGSPSQTDAHNWRRMCSLFHVASEDLCWSLALVAKRLCSTLVDPNAVVPFLACRLIALDKNPGVRPIGICKVPRRIIAKAVLSITKQDVLDAAGLKQLCASKLLVSNPLFTCEAVL